MVGRGSVGCSGFIAAQSPERVDEQRVFGAVHARFERGERVVRLERDIDRRQGRTGIDKFVGNEVDHDAAVGSPAVQVFPEGPLDGV